jgi:peroxiredoxin
LLKKIEQARSKGFKHGTYEGNELQLPATFLINSQKKIEFVYYGKDYADIPDHNELVALL